jgi:transposase, IS5 family
MQKSFSDLEFGAKKKQTRRERFLGEIEALVPWVELIAEIDPYYPKGGKRGRPPIGLERMLRLYIVQQCFALSDEGIEDAVYDSQAIRSFVRIDLSRENAPDATTVLHFRHLLEAHGLTRRVFETIKEHLAEKGLLLKEGTIVDATIIAAPSSTKNAAGARDPEMHQVKKGNQWHFGMKAHIGVDCQSGLVHSLAATPANVSDVTKAHELLHGEESEAFGDAGYRGAGKRPEARGKVRWHVAMRHSERRALPNTRLGRITEKIETLKASIRARIEHPFHIVKNRFGHRRTRYRGLAKNASQLFTLFGLANLLIAKKAILAGAA